MARPVPQEGHRRRRSPGGCRRCSPPRRGCGTSPGASHCSTGSGPGLATTGGGRVAVTALHGLGGVGKTQLAVEYAHRHGANYEAVLWVDAEQTSLIAGQLAALAGRLGLPATGQVTDDAAVVLDALRRRDGWLLVYDNAEHPAGLRPWLPAGPGHTLITSRLAGWRGLADPVEIDVMPRTEAVDLLTRRFPALDRALADALADALGDLPLALEQAAAYLDTTGTPPERHLARLRTEQARMLGKGEDLAHGGTTIAALWRVTLDALDREHPDAVRLLNLCAHLGPDPIPLALFHPDGGTGSPGGSRVADGAEGPLFTPAELDDALDTIAAYSLARRADDTLTVHRLLAAVLRAQQPDHDRQACAATVRGLLAAGLGGTDPGDPTTCPVWAPLAGHLTTAPALHPDTPTEPIHADSQSLLYKVSWHLTARGDYRAAASHDHAHHERNRNTLGDDHSDTLGSASNLAVNLRQLGEVGEARTLDEDTLARRRRTLGDDHPDTLRSANNLAIDLRELGEVAAAEALEEEVRRRQAD